MAFLDFEQSKTFFIFLLIFIHLKRTIKNNAKITKTCIFKNRLGLFSQNSDNINIETCTYYPYVLSYFFYIIKL